MGVTELTELFDWILHQLLLHLYCVIIRGNDPHFHGGGCHGWMDGGEGKLDEFLGHILKLF